MKLYKYNVFIYGVIGESGLDAISIISEIKNMILKTGKANILVNSAGGSVDDAIMIAEYINNNYRNNITITCLSYAGSAAMILILLCKCPVFIGSLAKFYYHKPFCKNSFDLITTIYNSRRDVLPDVFDSYFDTKSFCELVSTPIRLV